MTCYGILIGENAARGQQRVEESKFDQLLRKAAQQGTRRKALGVLAGGALLLGSRSAGEANEKAKRRRKRKINKRKRAASELLPIQVTVFNPGPRSVYVEFVNLIHSWSLPLRWICLTPPPGHSLFPGGSGTFFTRPVPGNPLGRTSTDGFVWIKGTYSIEFWNLLFHTPSVSAAVNGVSMNNRRHCPNRGTRALNDTALEVGQTFKFKIYDKEFTVKRLPDTKYKVFELTLPVDI